MSSFTLTPKMVNGDYLDLAKVKAAIAEHGILEEVRILVHSADDWRTAALRAGLEPKVEMRKGGLIADLSGIPVYVAPLIVQPGQIVTIRGDLRRGFELIR